MGSTRAPLTHAVPPQLGLPRGLRGARTLPLSLLPSTEFTCTFMRLSSSLVAFGLAVGVPGGAEPNHQRIARPQRQTRVHASVAHPIHTRRANPMPRRAGCGRARHACMNLNNTLRAAVPRGASRQGSFGSMLSNTQHGTEYGGRRKPDAMVAT